MKYAPLIVAASSLCACAEGGVPGRPATPTSPVPPTPVVPVPPRGRPSGA
jgi:hypothetical protein